MSIIGVEFFLKKIQIISPPPEIQGDGGGGIMRSVEVGNMRKLWGECGGNTEIVRSFCKAKKNSKNFERGDKKIKNNRQSLHSFCYDGSRNVAANEMLIFSTLANFAITFSPPPPRINS